MKDSVKPGLSTTRRITVDRPRTIDFLGEGGRVYSSPALINDIELTSREMLLPHLEPGQDSVGTRFELDHLAPTPLGMWVDISVTVAEVAGRAVLLDVFARDALDDVMRGRHGRAVVPVAKMTERVAAKAAKGQAA